MSIALKLSKTAGVARYALADAEVSVLRDDVTSKADIRLHYETLSLGLDRRKLVFDALGERLKVRPDPPPRRTLEDAVCQACHRLGDLRHADHKGWIEGRKTLVTSVLTLLD